MQKVYIYTQSEIHVTGGLSKLKPVIYMFNKRGSSHNQQKIKVIMSRIFQAFTVNSDKKRQTVYVGYTSKSRHE